MVTNVESIGKNTKMSFWGLRWSDLAPQNFSEDVWSEGLDQYGGDLFEMQLLEKIHPNRVTESKVMPSWSPYINFLPIKLMGEGTIVISCRKDI